jgi:hypothetical protein
MNRYTIKKGRNKLIIKTMQEFYRQGDILIVKVSQLAPGVKKASDKIIALGETTGHKHQISGSATVFDPPAFSGEGLLKFIEVPESAELIHDEHGTITLSKGIYECRRQREYDEKEICYVAD